MNCRICRGYRTTREERIFGEGSKKMYENQRRNLKKIERIEVVKKRKEIIKPKTEIKKDIPLGKIENAF